MVEEKYICSKADGCSHTPCTHRVPHDLDEDVCYAPPGHFSNPSYSCGIMPETRCVPVLELAKKVTS